MNKKNEDIFNSLFKKRNNKSPIDIKLFKNRKKNFGSDIKFKRSINSLILNINGEKPLILYKKSPTKIKKIELRHNNYMTDGGIEKKTKKFFNEISKYCSKKEIKNEVSKEKDNSSNKKSMKFKSFSLSNNKSKKKKNNFFKEKKEQSKNKIKTKYEDRYNLFLKGKTYNSEKREISSYNNPHIILKSKTKVDYLLKNNYLLNNITKIKKYNTDTKNQIQKFFFMGKKIEYLKSNNIDISKSESNIDKDEKESKEEKEPNLNQHSKSHKNNNKNFSIEKPETVKINNKNINKQKPIIDQFEYIKKINIIHNKNKGSSKSINILKYYNLIKNEHKIMPKSLNINTYKNNKSNSMNDELKNDDGYLFAHKKNHRNKKELKIFTQKKNSEEKKNLKEKEKEKTKKLYKKFKNLYKLNIENIKLINQQNNRKSLNINNQNSIKLRERRLKNNNYKDKINNNDSTYIEPKDYFFTLYKSRQLIINSNIEIDNENIFEEKKPKMKKKKLYNNIKLMAKILKKIMRKKAFANFYFVYFKKRYYHHYFLSIKFFISIMKQYAFKKIYLYKISDKKESNNKIIYLTEFLSLVFKLKVFEKIYNYAQQQEIKLVKENLEKIFKTTKKYILSKIFKKIKDSKKNNNIKNDKDNDVNNEINEIINDEINEEINEDINEELNANENIINNNLNNIYSDGLENAINEINNTDEKNKIYKETNDDFIFTDIEKEIPIPRDTYHNDTNINYINIFINNNINNIINDKNILDKKGIDKEKDNKYVINHENNKKNNKEFDELLGEIKQMKSYSECSGQNNESKSSKETNNVYNENNKAIIKSNKINKNVNISLKKEIKVINIIQEKNEKKVLQQDNKKNSSKFDKLFKDSFNLNNFIDKLTEDIIKNICNTEIKQKNKLLPNKLNNNNELNINSSLKLNQNSSSENNNNNKNDINLKLNTDLISLGIEHFNSNNSNTSLNNSLIFSSSIYSVFNKTILEKKKDLKENFFFDKIFPKILKIIKDELIEKYKIIYDYIISPVKIKEEDFLVTLKIEDTETVIKHYKKELFKEKIDEILNKKILLNKLNQTTNEIRNKYCLETEIIYGKILNECIVDSLLELINKVKLSYNIKGNKFIFNENDEYLLNELKMNLIDENKFSNYICKSLFSLLKVKLGQRQNELDLINEDKIKEKNEIKLYKEIKEEILEKDKEILNNYKLEETKIKFDISEYIFNILIQETVDILDNIQNGRKYLKYDFNSSIFQNDDDMVEIYNNNYGESEDDIINY